MKHSKLCAIPLMLEGKKITFQHGRKSVVSMVTENTVCVKELLNQELLHSQTLSFFILSRFTFPILINQEE